MLEMDRRTIAAGVSSLDLMERAGAGCWKAIVASLPDTSLSRVVVLCGPGNNGGDGLIVARQMHQSGLRPIALLCSARRYSADCQAALSRALETGLDVRLFGGVGPEAFQGLKIVDQRGATELFADATLVVDGLLGTGQVEAPRDSIAEILNCQASVKTNAQRVSIDLPTGVNCDTGLVYEPHFKADLTLAIQCIKRGLLQYPARSIAGKLQQIEIEIDTSSGCEFSQISTELLGRLEKRRLDSHKGTFGNVLIIGGCKRFPGAPTLSARAAARAGAGSVSKAHLSGLPFGDETPEVMPVPIDSGSEQVFKPSNISQLMAAISAAKACVVGPGLGTDPATGAFLTELFSKIPHSMPLVVDADALN